MQKYEEPFMNIVKVEMEDIVTLSGTDGGSGDSSGFGVGDNSTEKTDL